MIHTFTNLSFLFLLIINALSYDLNMGDEVYLCLASHNKLVIVPTLKRNCCDTSGNLVKRIHADSGFWDNTKEKLQHFYHSAILPELALPRCMRK